MIVAKIFWSTTPAVFLLGVLPFILSVAANSYVEPLWYTRIETEDDTGLLQRCRKRTRKLAPPQNGTPCARRPKLCFFGLQDCDGVGAHPELSCVCDGKDGTQTWQCEPSTCPIYPDPSRTRCPADGSQVIDHGNDPACPLEMATEFTDCPFTPPKDENDYLFCAYGFSNCCGSCGRSSFCECLSTGWSCESEFADGSICRIDGPDLPGGCNYVNYSNLVGGTCVEARTRIFTDFPGLEVICLSESDPKPTDVNFFRYVIVTDDVSGTVTSIDAPPDPFFDSCPVIPSPRAPCQFSTDDEVCFYEEKVTTFVGEDFHATLVEGNGTCTCDRFRGRGFLNCTERTSNYTRTIIGE